MGHHVPIVTRFRSALGAKKALRAEGVETLPELMDKYFERIPAARLMTGDVIALPGLEGGFDALAIYGQLRAVLGWQEESPRCQTARLTDEGYRLHTGAWNYEPRTSNRCADCWQCGADSHRRRGCCWRKGAGDCWHHDFSKDANRRRHLCQRDRRRGERGRTANPTQAPGIRHLYP